MVYGYFNNLNELIMTSKQELTIIQMQTEFSSVTHCISGIPDGLLFKDNDDGSYHKHNYGDGTDSSHYTLEENIIVLREIKYNEINIRTKDLIIEGFEYNGERFSNSKRAQINWTRYYIAVKDGIETNFPLTITKFNDAEYELIDANSVIALWSASYNSIKGFLKSGLDLKVLVSAAVTKASIDAIEDNR